jgi:hypothetical protein
MEEISVKLGDIEVARIGLGKNRLMRTRDNVAFQVGFGDRPGLGIHRSGMRWPRVIEIDPAAQSLK